MIRNAVLSQHMRVMEKILSFACAAKGAGGIIISVAVSVLYYLWILEIILFSGK